MGRGLPDPRIPAGGGRRHTAQSRTAEAVGCAGRPVAARQRDRLHRGLTLYQIGGQAGNEPEQPPRTQLIMAEWQHIGLRTSTTTALGGSVCDAWPESAGW